MHLAVCSPHCRGQHITSIRKYEAIDEKGQERRARHSRIVEGWYSCSPPSEDSRAEQGIALVEIIDFLAFQCISALVKLEVLGSSRLVDFEEE